MVTLQDYPFISDPIGRQIERGLVGYWPLASDGAVNLFDYSGNALNLTNNNGVTRAAGPSNNLPDAASFAAASSQYFSRDGAAIDFTRTFTIFTWFYLNAVDANYSLATKDATGDREAALNVTSGNVFQMRLFDGATSTVAAVGPIQTVAAITWYFGVARFNQNTLLVDVSLNAQFTGNGYAFGTATGAPGSSAASFRIGAREFAAIPYLDGRMATLGFAQEWMSDAEIAWLYNNGAGRDLLRGV